MNAYGESVSEFQNSLNKNDMFPVDPKLHENDYSNGSIELRGESVFISCETGKPNQNAATNDFEKSTNDFQSAIADSDKNISADEKFSEKTSSKFVENINGSHCKCNPELKNEASKNTKEKLESYKSNNTKHAAIEQEQNSKDYEIKSKVDIVRVKNLYSDSFDIFEKDCPKVENAWPDLYPYEKTEEIPVKELESLELKGIFTKYLKLDLSDEFIIIKITSGSKVLVNAAMYEKSESKHTSSPEYKPTDNSFDNYDSKKSNDDVAVVSTSISNDRGFKGENYFNSADVSLEETNIKKEKSLSSEKRLIDSFENSASGNDFHNSETEIIKDVFTEMESVPECGNFERDYVKSIVSEDEEVDCAPTRVRMLNPIPASTNDTLNAPSLYSVNTSLIGKMFRKKHLIPIPQQSKATVHSKMHNVISESKEATPGIRCKSHEVPKQRDVKTSEFFI